MRVLLAEDDRRGRETLASALHAQGYDVVIAADGRETLMLARERLPDVIVLDMMMPRLDGLTVLAELPKLLLEKKPRIIAALPCESEYIRRRARALGAGEIFRKPLKPERLAAVLALPGAAALDERNKKKTEALLRRIGVTAHTKGRMYLTEAIAMTADDYARIEHMRDAVYEPIAARHGTRAPNVERLIRHTIETACVHGRLEPLHALFGYTLRRDTGKPTNAEFIALLADNIRRGG